MEIKKTPKADLENKKSTWLLVGYVIVLAFMFIAFEWTKRDIKIDTSQAITDLVFEEEIIPITEQPEQAAPPPPPAAPPIAETLTIAQENGTQGRVTVQFVVNRDGSIVDAKVLRGVDPYLDKEAIRVISSMPKWKPGMQRGKAVRVKYTVPVMFRLQ